MIMGVTYMFNIFILMMLTCMPTFSERMAKFPAHSAFVKLKPKMSGHWSQAK